MAYDKDVETLDHFKTGVYSGCPYLYMIGLLPETMTIAINRVLPSPAK